MSGAAKRWASTAWAAALCLICCPATVWSAEAPASSEVSVQDFLAALLEVSLADGRISNDEQQAMLSAARRTLDESHLHEFKERLAVLLEHQLRSQSHDTSEQIALPASLDGRRHSFFEPPQDDSSGSGGSVTGDSELVSRSDSRRGGLLDGLYLTSTLDGFKSPVDFGLNAHFSFNQGVNWGFSLLEQYGIGAQLGTSVNFADFLVPSFKSATGLDERFQSFTTFGLYQRSDCGLSWGFVYDFLFDDYYLNMNVGQWRMQVGYQFRPSDELGMWAAIGQQGDSGRVDFPFAKGTVRWEPVTQGNLYWRHTWSNSADTRWWFGVADTQSDFVFGGDFSVPLSDKIALIGSANFLVSPAEGSTTASTGLAIYPWGGARQAGQNRFAPLLPVANNGTFVVDRF